MDYFFAVSLQQESYLASWKPNTGCRRVEVFKVMGFEQTITGRHGLLQYAWSLYPTFVPDVRL